MDWLFPARSHHQGFGDPFGYARQFEVETDDDDEYPTYQSYYQRPRTRSELYALQRAKAQRQAELDRVRARKRYAHDRAVQQRRERQRAYEQELYLQEQQRRLQEKQQREHQREAMQQAYVEELLTRKRYHKQQAKHREEARQQADALHQKSVSEVPQYKPEVTQRRVRKDREHGFNAHHSNSHIFENIEAPKAYAVPTRSGEKVWMEIVDETPSTPDNQKMPEDSTHILELIYT